MPNPCQTVTLRLILYINHFYRTTTNTETSSAFHRSNIFPIQENTVEIEIEKNIIMEFPLMTPSVVYLHS
jgi:hypothetical protein